MITKIKKWLQEEFSFLEGNFLVLMQSYVLSGFASGLWFLFRSNYIQALGASLIEIGLISSVGSVISAVIAIPGAYIADRYGRKRVIVVFTYFLVLGYLIHAFAPSWWWILVGSVILNLSRVYMPALEAIEADSLPEEKRGMGYSLISMAPSIFSAISPPIAGIIVSRYELIPGMRILYLATTGIILAIAVLRTFYLEETLETKDTSELSGLWSHIMDSLYSFRQATKDITGKLVSFTLMEILYAFDMPIYDVYLSLFALDVLGITKIQWGLLNSVFLPVTILIGIPAGKLVDKTPRRHNLLIAYTFSALVSIVFTYSTGVNWVFIAIFLRAIGQIIAFPAVHSLRADLMPKEKRGRLLGLLTLVKRLTAVPSALLFAWMFSVNPRALFQASFMINILTLLIIFSSFRDQAFEG